MSGELVLSCCPGAGLLDSAFRDAGFTVVSGPDALFGGDIRREHYPPNVFVGVIGGPPCQTFSTASTLHGTRAVDLIPDFVRVVNECRPSFVVMENVPPARKVARVPSEWFCTILRDWDCGGETHRRRAFWTWPFMVPLPPRRQGTPTHSVMASTAKRGRSDNPFLAAKGYLAGDLPIAEYARLQGVPNIGAALEASGAGRQFAVKVLGNGVPYALGSHVANAARVWLDGARLEATA